MAKWYHTFDDQFWIMVAGMLLGFLGLLAKSSRGVKINLVIYYQEGLVPLLGWPHPLPPTVHVQERIH